MARTTIKAVLLVCVAFAAAACDGEPDYTVTKQGKQATPAPSQQAPGGAADASSDISYKTPEGWQQDPTPRMMREATFLIGEGDKSAEVVVTRLASQFGDIGDNINRWRGQIGLEPLENPASVEPRVIKTPVGDAKLYKLEGTDKASIIALIEQGDQVWFFRLTGEKSTVLANEPKLEQLLSSLAAGKREQA